MQLRLASDEELAAASGKKEGCLCIHSLPLYVCHVKYLMNTQEFSGHDIHCSLPFFILLLSRPQLQLPISSYPLTTIEIPAALGRPHPIRDAIDHMTIIYPNQTTPPPSPIPGSAKLSEIKIKVR